MDVSVESISSLLKSSDDEVDEDHDDIVKTDKTEPKLNDLSSSDDEEDQDFTDEEEVDVGDDPDGSVLLLDSSLSAEFYKNKRKFETLVDDSTDGDGDEIEVIEIVSAEQNHDESPDEDWSVEAAVDKQAERESTSAFENLFDKTSVLDKVVEDVDNTWNNVETSLEGLKNDFLGLTKSSSRESAEIHTEVNISDYEDADDDVEVVDHHDHAERATGDEVEEQHKEDAAKKSMKPHKVSPDEGSLFDLGCRVLAARTTNAEVAPGVVAERPNIFNKRRYLIIFDNNEPAYVKQSLVRRESHNNKSVTDVRSFLKNYQAENPLLKLTVGEHVKVEVDDKWWNSSVTEIDCKLVRVKLEKNDQLIWFYRGSPRLGPMFAQTKAKDDKKRNGSYAKKSSSKRNGPVGDSSNKSVIDRTKGQEGVIVQEKIPVQEESKFTPHTCSSSCLLHDQNQYSAETMFGRTKNILTIPLHHGWTRQITKHSNMGMRKVVYVAPCGRRLLRLGEVNKYLRLTGSQMEIDFFNFDWWVHVLDEFRPDKTKILTMDISFGVENIPVSCCNTVDTDYPAYMEYTSVRLPQNKVMINTDPGFMLSCDCEDDCQDPSKCRCVQLTLESTQGDKFNTVRDDVGYEFRRIKVIQTNYIFLNSTLEAS